MDYNLFIDSDILLDILLIRHPHFDDSLSLFSLRIEKQVELFTTPSIILNVNYIANKQYNKEKAKRGVAEILKVVEIIETSGNELVNCFNSDYTDVEDAVQYFTALKNTSLHFYITRNIKHFDFKKIQLPVVTPTAF
ncbi:MAG: PIN domain-containing protein, partial [Ginsengibacter sp.]